MKTSYKGISLKGTPEEIAWFWGLSGSERQRIYFQIKRKGLHRTIEDQRNTTLARIERLKGHLSSDEFKTLQYLEKHYIELKNLSV